MKPVGKPDAVIPHVRFDERRLETELRRELRHRHRRKQSKTVQPRSLRPPRQSSTLPITVYNPKGFYEAPENAISVNNVTAKKDADGAVTVHFGGDPTQPNYLRIMPGWNYTVRLYRPRPEVLDGKWTFPEASPAS